MKHDFSFKRLRAEVKKLAESFWAILSRRIWMKLLSLLLAILLWNFVVTTNTSITRSKTISGISGYVTSQSALTAYGLAMLTDPTELIADVTVRLEVAQTQYSQVSQDNVQVMLDLSSVRTAGTQQVPLRATCAYGRVTDIMPAAVTLTFETLDSRSVPVNVKLSGTTDDGYWYNVTRTNPSVITVSGAASVVRGISQALVKTDVTGAETSYVRAEAYELLDYSGEEVNRSMLTSPVSSITVMTDVYPTREIPISTDIEDVVAGRVADGYAITEISIQPASITVAADADLLSGINELVIEPVSVDGASQNVSARAKISLLKDFKYASTEQVYVNIIIGEERVSEWIDNVSITFVGKADNLQLDWKQDDIMVYTTGPRSAIEALKKDGIPVTVDLTNLSAGEYSCELRFPTENYPDVSFEPETPAVSLRLIERAE